MIFSKKFTVEVLDTNSNDIIRPSALLRFMQETANHNMRSCRPTYEELFAQGLAFILSRISVKLYSPIRAYEEITVESWPCKEKGVTFPRSYRIYRGDEIVAEGASIWALVDTVNKKLLRNGDIDMSNYTFDEQIALPLRFRIPSDLEMLSLGKHTVGYSEIDCNMHMNNTNYPDMICNMIPDIESKLVREFVISFASEAPYKKELDITMGEDANEKGVYYFRTLISEKTNIEAKVTTGPIS